MRVALITPAPPGSRKGNRITALRWAAALRALGHRVAIATEWTGEPCDVLVALHARRSAPAAERFRAAHAQGALIVALTGTDLYVELAGSPEARRALELASRVVVLQPRGIDALPIELRPRARAITQSARAPARARPPFDPEAFAVCVIGHLRDVKDPFRAADAARRLPASSRIQVAHIGGELEPGFAARARAEASSTPRWHWLGERPRQETLELLAGCRLLAVTSRSEGGANVVSEALACRVPVISSRIDGTIGLLGDDYPGYFPVGDGASLAELLLRTERDPAFLAALDAACAEKRPLVDPQREREAWRALLAELR